MEKKRFPLSIWMREIFFEDNASFGRRTSRMKIVGKIASSIPKGFALAFSNFASSYPRREHREDVAPQEPKIADELVVAEWPRLEDGRERGLPHGDSTASRIVCGGVLSEVHDLVFAMKELHRVAVAGGELVLRADDPALVPFDPLVVRAVTRRTIDFFCEPSPRAERVRAAGLFTVISQHGDELRLRVEKTDAPARPRKIDIGSGTQPRAGYTGIDRIPMPGVEIVRDVERHGLPFSDSTISHVHAAHVLEHVRDVVFVMNEIHRVCCHDAIVDLVVPTLLGPYAAADPTHVHLFNARTFAYFEAGSGEYAGINKGFEIVEQSVGLSIYARLRVVKPASVE